MMQCDANRELTAPAAVAADVLQAEGWYLRGWRKGKGFIGNCQSQIGGRRRAGGAAASQRADAYLTKAKARWATGVRGESAAYL